MRNIFLLGAVAAFFVACDKPTEPTPVVVATPTEMLSSLTGIASGNVLTYGAAKTTLETDLLELNLPCGIASAVPKLPTLASLNSLATMNPMQITQEFTAIATQTIVVNPGERISPLPTGLFDYSNVTSPIGCNGIAPTASEDWIVKWKTKTGKAVQFVLDWDGSSTGAAGATVKTWVGGGNGSNNSYIELPTKLRGKLTVDATSIVEISMDASYRKHPTIADSVVITPNSGSLKILANTLAGKKLLDVSAALNIDAAGVRTTGAINATHGSDSMAASWDLNIAGTPTFDINNNNISGFAFVGASTVKAALSQNAKTMDVSFGFNSVSPANLLGAKLVSAVITDGVINLEGKKVTFSGTLNDTNANCVYGDAVNVQFKSETKTLEKLLLDSNMAKTCLRP